MQKDSPILKDLKHLEYISKNKPDIVSGLIDKGYNDDEIIKELDNYEFKNNWNGNYFGFILLAISGVLLYFIKPVRGFFEYKFSSSGDFLKLNELVLKPFLALLLIFIGINIIINRGYVNRNLKLISIAFLLFFCFSILRAGTINSNPLTIIASIVAIVTLLSFKLNSSKKSDGEVLLNYIKSEKSNKNALKQIFYKKWKGSSIFVFLLLSFILFIITSISIDYNDPEKMHIPVLLRKPSSFENILLITSKILLFGSFICALLMNINYKMFKFALIGLMVISAGHIIASFTHIDFQPTIYPALMILLSGTFKLLTKNTFANKTSYEKP